MIERIADGRTDLVFEHLAAGGAADAADAHGVRLIQWCAYYGDVSAIRHLCDRGEQLESLGANFDLNGAAFHGHWRLCQYLLERGADANHPLPETGEVPLHAALCKANRTACEHVVRVLLAHGADPGRTTFPGRETGSFMRDCRTRGETPLHRAAAFGTEACIQLLLDAGARRETQDAHCDSPLSWASWHLRPATILRLLCHGEFRIPPLAISPATGESALDLHLLGKPH